MRAHQVLLGVASGFALGYAAQRLSDVLRARRTPEIGPRSDAAAYGRLRRSLALCGVARSLAQTYAFAYGPSGEQLERAVERAPSWLRAGLFAASAAGAGALVELPIAFVEEYTIERRYGLSDQAARAWCTDYAKMTLVSVAVIAPLASLADAVVQRARQRWPWIASLGITPLLVLANVVVPLYILPLFNRFEPLRGPLEERLRALAARFGVGDAQILRMDMSRQTKKANAFVIGVGRTHRIVLGDTLIDHFTANEIEFIVAHELGHYVTMDTWRMIGATQLLFSALAFGAQRITRDDDRSGPLALARIYAVTSLGGILLRPLLLAFSRSREWAADRFALATTNDAANGAAAFRRLRDQNRAEEDVPRWFELFFSTHPNLGARIAALDAAAAADS